VTLSSRRLALCLGLAGALLGSRVSAQILAPGPPGPFVIDVRGATSGIPASPGLYPTLSETFTVPARGFGIDVGGHVYPLSLRAARLGIGVNLTYVRGTSVDATATVRTIDPQISFNFGTANGWSYLSAGLGTARVSAGTSVSVQAINAGGGARWFLTRHTAVSFDVRLHKLSAEGATMPASTLVSASVGLSLK
jgi:hypothetical protein